MAENNDLTKDGKPRSWRGMRMRLKQLEAQVEQNEQTIINALSKIKAQNNAIDAKDKEIKVCRVREHADGKTISQLDEIVKKQANEINKIRGEKYSLETDKDLLEERIAKLMNRGFWARLFNRDVE